MTQPTQLNLIDSLLQQNLGSSSNPSLAQQNPKDLLESSGTCDQETSFCHFFTTCYTYLCEWLCALFCCFSNPPSEEEKRINALAKALSESIDDALDIISFDPETIVIVPPPILEELNKRLKNFIKDAQAFDGPLKKKEYAQHAERCSALIYTFYMESLEQDISALPSTSILINERKNLPQEIEGLRKKLENFIIDVQTFRELIEKNGLDKSDEKSPLSEFDKCAEESSALINLFEKRVTLQNKMNSFRMRTLKQDVKSLQEDLRQFQIVVTPYSKIKKDYSEFAETCLIEIKKTLEYCNLVHGAFRREVEKTKASFNKGKIVLEKKPL
jgi:hypothetical protein